MKVSRCCMMFYILKVFLSSNDVVIQQRTANGDMNVATCGNFFYLIFLNVLIVVFVAPGLTNITRRFEEDVESQLMK